VRLWLRCALLARGGAVLGLAEAVALALDADDVGVVDHAVDERGSARRVGKDGGPLLEREVRGEDEALSLVAAADDLEEEIGISVVEGEIADLVDLCGAPHNSIHVECLLMWSALSICKGSERVSPGTNST